MVNGIHCDRTEPTRQIADQRLPNPSAFACHSRFPSPLRQMQDEGLLWPAGGSSPCLSCGGSRAWMCVEPFLCGHASAHPLSAHGLELHLKIEFAGLHHADESPEVAARIPDTGPSGRDVVVIELQDVDDRCRGADRAEFSHRLIPGALVCSKRSSQVPSCRDDIGDPSNRSSIVVDRRTSLDDQCR